MTRRASIDLLLEITMELNDLREIAGEVTDGQAIEGLQAEIKKQIAKLSAFTLAFTMGEAQ